MSTQRNSFDPQIIFEDSQIVVIDKPAGMVVNRAETTKGIETVQDWAEKYLKVPRENKVPRVPQACDTHDTLDSRDTFYERSGIVHRLDKETSGLLIVAKTPQAFVNLQAQFKSRTVKKKYLALVHGKVIPEDGEINAPVGRLPWNRERFGVMPGGKEAVTMYKVLSIKYKANDKTAYSFLELYPQTGRTHQIRVHLKFIGHPIVGDEFYAGRKQANEDRIWCPRIFLHASSISFQHPLTNEIISLEIPLPEDLKEVFQKL